MLTLTSQRKLWAWQFSKARTYGIGARIAAMEGVDREYESEGSKAVEEGRVEVTSQTKNP
jgi:hypothetical protein